MEASSAAAPALVVRPVAVERRAAERDEQLVRAEQPGPGVRHRGHAAHVPERLRVRRRDGLRPGLVGPALRFIAPHAVPLPLYEAPELIERDGALLGRQARDDGVAVLVDVLERPRVAGLEALHLHEIVHGQVLGPAVDGDELPAIRRHWRCRRLAMRRRRWRSELTRQRAEAALIRRHESEGAERG